MQIKQYIMPAIVSNMYIVSENNAAIIIDPHENEEARAFIKQSAFSTVDIFLTHEHFDHISGVSYFSEIARDVYASKKCAEIMAHPEMRRENRFSKLFFEAVGSDEIIKLHKEKPIVIATKTFEGDYSMEWKGHSIKMKETPGHSPGSICVVFDGDKIFTGDSLLPKKITITNFPGGDRKVYKTATESFLRSLNKNAMVYPGHGEITPLGECWI